MKSHLQKSISCQTRRDFIKTAAYTATLVTSSDLLVPGVYGQGPSANVTILSHPADELSKQPPVRWAIEQLQDHLKNRGVGAKLHSALDKVAHDTVCVLVAGRDSKWARTMLGISGLSVPDVPEATGLVCGKLDGRSVLLATGSDVRGLIYALLELADRVEYALKPIAELQKPD